MEKKQTAVQWLSERLIDILGDKCNNLTQEQTLANHYAFKQALQMEREQIEEAFKAALPLDDNPDYMADKYYNSKYGK